MKQANSYFIPTVFLSKMLSRAEKQSRDNIWEKKSVGPKKSDFSIPRYELHFSVVRYENEGFFLVLSGETIWISTRCIFFLQKFVFKISVFSFSVTSTHFLTSTSLYIDNNSKASDLLLLLDWFCGGAWLGIRSCERFGPTVSEKIGTS